MRVDLRTVALILPLLIVTSIAGLRSQAGNEGQALISATFLASASAISGGSTAASVGPVPGPLHVVGNSLVDQFGNRVVLKGVAIADQSGRRPLDQEDFEYLAETWNVKVVRIPVEPNLWDTGTFNGDNLTLLNQDVVWANEYGIYAIIDWHGGGNIATPNLEAGTPSLSQTEAFWSTVSRKFTGRAGVLYEIYNEPNGVTWSQWRRYAQEIVNVIRQHDPSTIILVSGVSLSFDLSMIPSSPIAGRNIAYVVHPYPPSCGDFSLSSTTSSCWPMAFGKTARLYPVFATEWGYYTPDQAACPSSARSWNWNGYGTSLVNYMESLNMSWTAWDWYPYGCPQMLLSFTDYEPTQFGQFVLTTLISSNSSSFLSQTLTLSHFSVNLEGVLLTLIMRLRCVSRNTRVLSLDT